MPPDLRVVLFDLDGTLIDSIALILASYRHTFMMHRGAPPADEVWLEGLGTPLSAQFRRFTDDSAEIAAMVDTYRKHNLAHHDAMVRAYPGIADAVRELRRRGRRLGIVTSKLRDGTARGLACVGLDGLFDVVVAADDVTRHKPDPEPVRRAIELFQVSADDAAFVGDSPHDMAAGRAAGVRIGAALWGPFSRDHLAPHAPDVWLETPEDLVRYFGGNGAGEGTS
jgi:pyrophosphatase PpaX